MVSFISVNDHPMRFPDVFPILICSGLSLLCKILKKGNYLLLPGRTPTQPRIPLFQFSHSWMGWIGHASSSTGKFSELLHSIQFQQWFWNTHARIVRTLQPLVATVISMIWQLTEATSKVSNNVLCSWFLGKAFWFRIVLNSIPIIGGAVKRQGPLG